MIKEPAITYVLSIDNIDVEYRKKRGTVIGKLDKISKVRLEFVDIGNYF